MSNVLVTNCPWCGMIHPTRAAYCPMVKAFEYYPDGSTKRVEFHDPTPPVIAAAPVKILNLKQCDGCDLKFELGDMYRTLDDKLLCWDCLPEESRPPRPSRL